MVLSWGGWVGRQLDPAILFVGFEAMLQAGAGIDEIHVRDLAHLDVGQDANGKLHVLDCL